MTTDRRIVVLLVAAMAWTGACAMGKDVPATKDEGAAREIPPLAEDSSAQLPD